MLKVFLSKDCFQETAEGTSIFSYRRCAKKGKNMLVFFLLLFERLQAVQIVFFSLWKFVVNTLMITNQLLVRR